MKAECNSPQPDYRNHTGHNWLEGKGASYTDPFGLCPACAVYVGFELASAAYDIYTTYKAFRNGGVEGAEALKASIIGGVAPGPGNAYRQIASRIGGHAGLAREAATISGGVQRSIDNLTAKLASGNLNPGLGTKHLFGDIYYARSRDGARVFFRQQGETIEIVGKATKQNEGRVIQMLEEHYK